MRVKGNEIVDLKVEWIFSKKRRLQQNFPQLLLPSLMSFWWKTLDDESLHFSVASAAKLVIAYTFSSLQLLVDAFLHINLANNIFALVFTTFCSVTADLLIYIFVLWVIFRTINPLSHHHEGTPKLFSFLLSILAEGAFETYKTTGDTREGKISPLLNQLWKSTLEVHLK